MPHPAPARFAPTAEDQFHADAERWDRTQQRLGDLLLLGSLAANAPLALLGLPTAEGGWKTLATPPYEGPGIDAVALYGRVSGTREPVEIHDLFEAMPDHSLVRRPYGMRWAYGVELRDRAGHPLGVVGVLDWGLRRVTPADQRALRALSRQLVQALTDVDEEPSVECEASRTTHHAEPSERAGRYENDSPQLMRSSDVAALFSVTDRTILNWAASGELPCIRTLGGHFRFRPYEVMALLRGQAADRRGFRPAADEHDAAPA
jgi:excisionase family DNA binding protein